MMTHWSNESSDWLTAVEVGEILGMSAPGVSRWGTLGKLPTRVENANISFYRQSVMDWKRSKDGADETAPEWVVALKRSEESVAREFRKATECDYSDVIYQTRRMQGGVEIVAYAANRGEWDVVRKKLISRTSTKKSASSKAGAK